MNHLNKLRNFIMNLIILMAGLIIMVSVFVAADYAAKKFGWE